MGTAATSRKRTPEAVTTSATSLAEQGAFDDPSFPDGAFHPYLSVEQRAALVLATQRDLTEWSVAGVTESRLKPVFLLAAVFLIAASATFAIAYLRGLERTEVGNVPGAVQELPIRSATLGLRAQAQGDEVVLRWNGNNPALQSATDGMLQVDDGAEHRQIALDRGGLTNASLVYRPVADDVVFRLEVRGTDGVRTAETLEVVGARARAADSEAQPEPKTADAAKTSTERTVAARPRSKERIAKDRSTADSRSGIVRSAPAQLSRTELPATPPSSRQTLAMQNPPSLPMNTVSSAQPSSLSGQDLPKPPLGPSIVERQIAPRDGTNTAGAPGKTVGRPVGAQQSGYVPPRPIKWSAPSAKSLGVRISAPTDFEIKVRIDESGHVTAAHALLDRTTHDESVSASVAAAVKQWVFEPAKMQGKAVPSEQTVVIRVDPRS
ncbi:MAG: hypothetical protein ACJ74Z_01330 [Bryobacteraceae bacterium]